MTHQIVHYLQHQKIFGLIIPSGTTVSAGYSIEIIDPSTNKILHSGIIEEIQETRPARIGKCKKDYEFVKAVFA